MECNHDAHSLMIMSTCGSMGLVLGWRASLLKLCERERERDVIAEFIEETRICFLCLLPSVQLLCLMFSDLAALCNY